MGSHAAVAAAARSSQLQPTSAKQQLVGMPIEGALQVFRGVLQVDLSPVTSPRQEAQLAASSHLLKQPLVRNALHVFLALVDTEAVILKRIPEIEARRSDYRHQQQSHR